MKVIDLEYLIANGEEVPKTIVYKDEIYGFRDDLKDYENQYADFEEGVNKFKYLFDNPLEKNFRDFFNDEVEILEEEKKIPEKLPIGLKQTKDGIFNTIAKDDIQYELNEKEVIICKKIHEIIDYLDYLKSKGE